MALSGVGPSSSGPPGRRASCGSTIRCRRPAARRRFHTGRPPSPAATAHARMPRAPRTTAGGPCPPSIGSPLDVSTGRAWSRPSPATNWMSIAASVLACTCTFTASAGLTVPGPYVGMVSTSTSWTPWLPLKKRRDRRVPPPPGTRPATGRTSGNAPGRRWCRQDRRTYRCWPAETLGADGADLHALGRLARFVDDATRDDPTANQRELQRTDRGAVGHGHAAPGRILA